MLLGNVHTELRGGGGDRPSGGVPSGLTSAPSTSALFRCEMMLSLASFTNMCTDYGLVDDWMNKRALKLAFVWSLVR